jgi:hypothetical protein
MKPGRKLDALISEKVMAVIELGELPKYSTVYSEARKVVDRIMALGFDFRLEFFFRKDGCIATFSNESDEYSNDEYVEDALAICLAALKTVEAEAFKQPR